MGNTHLIPDMMAELQGTTGDLLPACVVSSTFPAVPAPPSMIVGAFATRAYVRAGINLTYVDQEAHTVTLTGGDGQYWIAVSDDTFSSFSGWNRTAGTHYLWRLNATRPPDVDNLFVIIALTVSGGAITAVTPASGVTRAEALRALSGLGTMATQDAGAVAITGGEANGLSTASSTFLTTGQLLLDWRAPADQALYIQDRPSGVASAVYSLITAGTNRYNIHAAGSAPNYFAGSVGIAATPTNARVHMALQAGVYGLITYTTDQPNAIPLEFRNQALVAVGSIANTGTATSFNTSSDARLKHSIATLTGALERVRALRPVQFRWNSTDEQDEGFLAHELQQVAPRAVTGQPDELNDDGSIRPQQTDASKLIPLLTSALQAALAQIDALTARLSTLEQALGA